MIKLRYIFAVAFNITTYLVIRHLFGFEVAVLVGIAFIGADMDLGLRLRNKLNE